MLPSKDVIECLIYKRWRLEYETTGNKDKNISFDVILITPDNVKMEYVKWNM